MNRYRLRDDTTPGIHSFIEAACRLPQARDYPYEDTTGWAPRLKLLVVNWKYSSSGYYNEIEFVTDAKMEAVRNLVYEVQKSKGAHFYLEGSVKTVDGIMW